MSRTILLADDSITIQKVVEQTFLEGDYEVASFDNGDDAIGQLESIAPDLVIADIHMPGATGYEVARRVKQGTPRTPVLLLVGTFEPFDEADVEESGADGYLMKPFDSQELLSRVEDLFEDTTSGAAPEARAAPSVQAEPDDTVRASADAPASSEEIAVASPPAIEAAAAAADAPARLSDDEIDRIAKRVAAEITPEIVREVAREIIPEVAERVFKERLHEFEKEVE